MQRAERRAQQDKWLALAQVGLGLMSSTQPTLGGALGEAGLAGLQSYQGARDEYETERLGLSKELAGIGSARASALASQRAAAAKANAPMTLKEIDDTLSSLTKTVDGFGEDGLPMKVVVAKRKEDTDTIRQLEAMRSAEAARLAAKDVTQ